ncbi:MAG TPA: phage terminase small subunit [Allosphingosinicella sp.]|uniref:phage terminase small subunit n=1 Tax=Allosphingosinicella sp. TaxID=2823234 RepID=UPI002ED8FBB1
MHDLRRLKEIQSIERKIAAKHEMLPGYEAWIAGLLEAEREKGDVDKGEILPTIMIWCIDTGDFERALELARYVLRNEVPLPARYDRQAPCLIAEEISEAALKLLNEGQAFSIDVLEQLDELTADEDMPDEVKAKLMKAIGFEYLRQADAADSGGEGEDRLNFLRAAALAPLRRAQQLHDRCGAKTAIKRLEKLLKAAAATPPASPPPAAEAGAANDNTPPADETGDDNASADGRPGETESPDNTGS